MTTGAQVNNTFDNSGSSTQAATQTVSTTGGSKEIEPKEIVTKEMISETDSETELSAEVKETGVEVVKDSVEVPLDVKKLGVTPIGPQVPIAQTTTAALPKVSLPISDQTIFAGLQFNVSQALKWLAVWCIKKLKKAHLTLRQIHGKIVRVTI